MSSLRTTAAGTAIVTAAVLNGGEGLADFTRDFEITIKASTPIGSVVRTTAPGTAIVTATIKNGADGVTDYTQDFEITFKSPVPEIWVRLPNYNAKRPFTYIKVREAEI